MLPTVDEDFDEIEEVEYQNKTYALRVDEDRIGGYLDGVEAVRQAVYHALNTERYVHSIYDFDYGIETRDLLGQDAGYVVPTLERRIVECLSEDERIEEINGFEAEVRKSKITFSFNVVSIYGDFEYEGEVEE